MPLGPVLIDLAGPSLTAAEERLLLDPRVAGVVLFSRNYESPEQLEALTRRLHGLREPTLLVAVDHEGGRVQRFREGFTALPAAARLGALHDRDPAAARALAREAGWLLAVELRAVGVDFSFAPVLDLATGASDVIGDRAFHGEPQVVIALAAEVVAGMVQGGMGTVGKHFPGHGSVAGDSHTMLPTDPRPLEEIRRRDLQPFRVLASSLRAIMPAHVIYPAADPEPAGYSRYWLQDMLRGELGFRGAIVSDDLAMAGAAGAGDFPERARRALEAGCDLVLACNAPDAAAAVVDSLPQGRDWSAWDSEVRRGTLRGRDWAPSREALARNPRWHAVRRRLAELEASAPVA